MRNIFVLGSTGSIGTQTLEAAEQVGCGIEAIAAEGSDIELMERQIRKHKPKAAIVIRPERAERLRQAVADTATEVLSGTESLYESIKQSACDTVVNGISGMAGTLPSIYAVSSGKDLITANKEAIVTCGQIIKKLAAEHGAEIIPADSEHSAIFQCIDGKTPRKRIKRLILTASGGPFYGMSAEELRGVSKNDALRHPNWKMGKKITVDCATMMNKGLEIIEACMLFDVPDEKIDVLIHRQSIIHSMAEFCDNTVIAQLASPDMRLPLQYALTYPDRLPSRAEELDFDRLMTLTFARPDIETFKSLRLAREALREGGTAPTILNAANEIAVRKFLRDEICFADIADFTERELEATPIIHNPSIEQILQTDADIRRKYDVK